MFDLANISLFLVTAIVILVIPGPAVFYIVARSIEQGRWAGIVSVAGISAATVVHAIAATLGLSAILVSSALAFNIVKYLGAAYLVYLGIRTLMSKQQIRTDIELKKRSVRRLFVEGFIVNLFNPKTVLFFFAFIPQFIDVSYGSVPLQFLGFGLFMAALGFLSDGAYAIFAGSLADYLRNNERALNIQRYLSGTVLIGLGITTALARAEST